jgi:hypothetical protein
VEAFGAAVDLPVDVLDVVAGRVLAVLGELDGEAVPRAAVPPGQEPLDELARLQFEVVDPGEDVRIGQRHKNIVARRPVATAWSADDPSPARRDRLRGGRA